MERSRYKKVENEKVQLSKRKLCFTFCAKLFSSTRRCTVPKKSNFPLMFPRRQLNRRHFLPLALAVNVTVDVATAVYEVLRQETAMDAQLGRVGLAHRLRVLGENLCSPEETFLFLSAMRQKVLRQFAHRFTAVRVLDGSREGSS